MSRKSTKYRRVGIHYKSGFKYQLARSYAVQTGIYPEHRAVTQFLRLEMDGALTIEPGYAWDGPSGPARDTKTFMRASLVHDSLYQLLRLGLLGKDRRGAVDDEMHKICLEDGMWRVRAWWTWRAVKGLAAGAADPDALKTVLMAP